MLLLSALVTLPGCDPNVVIGTELTSPPDVATGATGATGGTAGSEAVGGAGGVGGAAGTSEAPDAGGGGAGGFDVEFVAEHEVGDRSEWEEGGREFGGWYGDVEPVISTARAHTGTHSLEFTIDTTAETAPVSRIFRRVVDGPAYYSAWFYLEEDHTPAIWWAIFTFKSREADQDLNGGYNLWDLNLSPHTNGLSVDLWDHLREVEVFPESFPIVPVGKWTHIEAYMNYLPPEPTELTFWIDGVFAFTYEDLMNVPGDSLYWAIGNGSNDLDPPVSTIYIDDAVISRERVGP